MKAKEIGRRFKLAREFAQRIADRCELAWAQLPYEEGDHDA